MLFDDDTLNSYVLKQADVNYAELLDKKDDLLCISHESGYAHDFPGYVVTDVIKPENASQPIVYCLEPAAGATDRGCICGHCNRPCNPAVHGTRGTATIRLHDCSKAGYNVILEVKQPRACCPHCHARPVLSPEFKHPCHNITKRKYGEIMRFLTTESLSVSDIARLTGVGQHIVSAIDKARLARDSEVPDCSKTRYIGIDEHAVLKRHNYVTVIFDLETRVLLFACEGKRKEDIQPFFDHLRKHGYDRQIRGLSCDCASGFIALAKENLPNAVVVIDQFHVLKKLDDAFNRVRAGQSLIWSRLGTLLDYRLRYAEKPTEKLKKAIDAAYASLARLNVPKEEADRRIEDCGREDLRRFAEASQSIDRTRWCIGLGMRRLEAYSRADTAEQALPRTQKAREKQAGRARLAQEVIKSNSVLAELMLLGDQCRDFWKCPYSPVKVKRYIRDWIKRARDLKEPALDSFCKFLERHEEYIIYAPSTGISNSPVEGLNSRAKAFQRVIRGVKDKGYYLLRLHHIFKDPKPVSLNPPYVRKNDRRFTAPVGN